MKTSHILALTAASLVSSALASSGVTKSTPNAFYRNVKDAKHSLLFTRSTDCGSGSTCEEACGQGYELCGTNSCYNSAQGDSCCNSGITCQNGQYCAPIDGYCCSNDLTSEECVQQIKGGSTGSPTQTADDSVPTETGSPSSPTETSEETLPTETGSPSTPTESSEEVPPTETGAGSTETGKGGKGNGNTNGAPSTNPPTGAGAAPTGLSAGAKAGIGIGVTVPVVAIIAGLGFFFYRRQQKNKFLDKSSAQPSMSQSFGAPSTPPNGMGHSAEHPLLSNSAGNGLGGNTAYAPHDGIGRGVGGISHTSVYSPTMSPRSSSPMGPTQYSDLKGGPPMAPHQAYEMDSGRMD